mmetsp:Transcript_5596/g.16971  ORF Transcript_5596/g.16971 Transcript_5596/m.16971 type:complete len:175 (-) Transcript_5596:189-713(-)
MAALGARVEVRDHAGASARGELYACARGVSALVIPAEGKAVDVTLVRADLAAEGVLVSASAPTEAAAEAARAPLPPLDLELAAQREARAVAKAEAAGRKVGIGVTPRAQAIFDKLSNTMECAWDGQSIVVLGEVVLSPPYEPAGVRGKEGATDLLVRRVATVLGNIAAEVDAKK